MFPASASAVTANRTYDTFNQNGWGRSLHFLSAWFLVVPGGFYLFAGIFTGHFPRHLWPRVHVAMVAKSGLKPHLRSMTWGR